MRCRAAGAFGTAAVMIQEPQRKKEQEAAAGQAQSVELNTALGFGGSDVQNDARSFLELFLEQLVQAPEKTDEEKRAEGIPLDDVEPIEAGRRTHSDLLHAQAQVRGSLAGFTACLLNH
jgi:hypothetical protein